MNNVLQGFSEVVGRVFLLACCVFLLLFPEAVLSQKLSNICTNIGCPETVQITNDPMICPRADQMRAGLLYDVNRNTIVFHKNLNATLPIASVTKMMVALITAEQVKSGKISWTDEVKFSQRIRTSRRSKNYKTVWYSYTLEDLLKSTLIASNNTSAAEIGTYVGGTLPEFIVMMNKRANELGMKSTSYSNPSGLPERRSSDDNVSSPADLLRLALTFMQHEDLMTISGMHYADIKINGRISRVVNTNRLVSDHQIEFLGLKTGYINRAGHCLVAAASVDSSVLISVVLGVQGADRRNSIIQEMMNNYYFGIGECRLGEVEHNQAFVQAVSSGQIKLSEEERNDYKTVYKGAKTVYTVRRGDNLSEIAQRFSCSISDLKKWNKISGTKIYEGQRIYVNTLVKSLEFSPDWMQNANSNSSQENITATSVASDKAAVAAPKVQSGNIIKTGQSTKHKVASGETLSQLATIFGCSVNQLMNWNSLTNSRIHAGQLLIVSTTSKDVDSDREVIHVVQSGETLSGISNRYRTSVESIQKANELTTSEIKIGQKLSIVQTVAGEVPVQKTVHIVKSGETLSLLAGKYKCSISQLQTWNNISGSIINIGQRIEIYNSGDPSPSKISASSKKEYMIYEVRSGDTLWEIARKFEGNSVNTIKKLNNIRNDKNIKPGMKLKIELVS